MMIVLVTDVSTWGLYTKCMICKLQLGVHCASIICTISCYGIGTNISDCDCQHGISYYCIYRSRLGVSVWIVSAEFISSRFCRVQFHDCKIAISFFA